MKLLHSCHIIWNEGKSTCSYTVYLCVQSFYILFAVVTIGFNAVTYSVLEDAGIVHVTVSVMNGTLARNVVVTLSTVSGGTATGKFNKRSSCTHQYKYFLPTSPAGTDYIDVTITLMFDATTSTQMVTVPILNDNVVEDIEFINLTLTSVDSAVTLNPETARINIEDVDSELVFAMLQFHCCAHTLLLQMGMMEAKTNGFYSLMSFSPNICCELQISHTIDNGIALSKSFQLVTLKMQAVVF